MKTKTVILGLICIVLLTIVISGCSEKREFESDFNFTILESNSKNYLITIECEFIKYNPDNGTIYFMPEIIELCKSIYPELWNDSDEVIIEDRGKLFTGEIGIGNISSSLPGVGTLQLGMDKINTSTPYISIDCDRLNKINWTNKNLSLEKDNKSFEVDLIKLCNEI